MANKEKSFYDLDTDKIKAQLNIFEDIDDLLDDIGSLADLSNSTPLVPNIFYNMTTSSAITSTTNVLGDNYGEFKQTLHDVISALKEDTNIIEKDPGIINLMEIDKVNDALLGKVDASESNSFSHLDKITEFSFSTVTSNETYPYLLPVPVSEWTPPSEEETETIEHRIVTPYIVPEGEEEEEEDDTEYEVVTFNEVPGEEKEIEVTPQDNDFEIPETINIRELNIDLPNNTYTVINPFKVIYNGETYEFTPGDYPIVDVKYDINGNIVAICLLINGQKVWLQVINGQVVTPEVDQGSSYTLKEIITIVVKGETINITPGDYKIYNVIYDANGRVKAICIEYNGMKIWIYFDESVNISRVEYITNEHGIINITKEIFYIRDMYGNIIGIFKPGKYYIYEIRYDANGKVIAIRVSPDGEYEEWLYFEDSKEDVDYYIFEEEKVKDDKKKLSFFDKNKTFFGALAVLFVAFGASLVVKKRKKKKKKKETDESVEYEEEYDSETLGEGSYLVYDYEEDQEGNIKAVKLNKTDDEDNEYWVEV